MKISILILLMFSALAIQGQIFTQSSTNGSITITPKGLKGKSDVRIDTSSVALGASALRNVSFAEYDKYNTAIGSSTLFSNTYGGSNTAIGASALYSNTNGSSNTAVGYRSLFSNFSGSFNTSTGFETLYFNMGSDNTANGFRALYNNINGSYNTANGAYALLSNQTGVVNTATGYRALYNCTGSYNTANGGYALYFNTTGSNNVAQGNNTLFLNTTGGSNTAIGVGSLFSNTVGEGNTAMGMSSMPTNTTGNYNTAIGHYSLIASSGGTQNTALGSRAGQYHVKGSKNTFIGANADISVSADSLINAMALGYDAKVNASNKVRVGDTNVTVIEGAVPWTTPSDRRLKQNITPSLLGLSFIFRLMPMSYTYIADKTNVRRDGLIAQDVEKVMQDLGVEFSGLQKSPDGTYSLTYSDFVMPLVNAAKELKQRSDEQQTEINDLKKKLSRMEELERRLLSLEASLPITSTGK